VRPNTIANYRRTVDKHIVPYFAKKKLKLSDIGWPEIENYMLEKATTLCSGSLKCHKVVLNQVLKTARKHGYILVSPMQDVELPESKKKSTISKFVPNGEQFSEILFAMKNEELLPLIVLTASLGLRRSEVTALKWEVYDEKKQTLEIRNTFACGKFCDNVTKSGSSHRQYPLDAKLCAMLARVRAQQEKCRLFLGNAYTDEGFIFTRSDGTHYNPEYLTRVFPTLVAKAGFPRMTFHALRKFACSALMNDSVSSAEVAKYVGHSNITVFYNHYAYLDTGHKLELTERITQKLGTALGMTESALVSQAR
jgi:integrase